MARPNPLDRLNCGPVKFSGDSNALYERHLTFDHVIPLASATPRNRFEAVARSVRDLLSQRWIKTEQTYQDAECQTGLLSVARIPDGALAGEQHHQPAARPRLEPVLQAAQDRSARNRRAGARRRSRQRRPRPVGGLLSGFDGDARHSGNGLRPALRVRHLQADHTRRLAARTAGSLARPARSVGSPAAGRSGRGATGLLVRHSRGALRIVHGRPSTLIGIPYDRPVVGYGGKNHQYAALVVRRYSGLLRFPAVQQRRLRRRAGRNAHGRNADAGASTRTTRPPKEKGCASCSSTSSWPARWPTLSAVSALPATTGPRCPTKWRCSSTTRTRRSRCPS